MYLKVVSRLIAAAVVPSALALAQSTPKTGAEVFQRMHDAYAGKWYRSLTFTQKTTTWPGGKETAATWYESLRLTGNRTELRIDVGDPANGNGVLYTADSVWRVRGGKLAGAQEGGNEFLPLIEGVYFNPVEQTIRELSSTKVDMSHVSEGKYDNRRVWIIGATPPDTTTPQIWIDVERNVAVRAILSPAPTTPVLDIHLDGYVPIDRAWLATKIRMNSGGAPRQVEEYRDWKVNVNLPAGLFDVATWTTAPHWAAAKQP